MGSHRKWRVQAKKMRRKRIRQQVAQKRDEIIRKDQDCKENSPKYQVWLSEQRALELFTEEEEARLSAEQHNAWLAEEERAQKAWKERQERLVLARAERAKQELRIKEEWEEEQQKLKAAKKEQERIAAEKQHKQEELMKQIENFINKGGDMPLEVNVASVTNPDRPPCPFFTKTGACRFGDRCSRNHTRPAISRVLLVPNFYDHIGLRQMNPDELEAADDWLEYEDSETYHHFVDFYEDVLPEWECVGRISQFKVCCNFEPHLRGNVYIEYESAQDAVKAFKMFHGRFYGGKQINVEFVTIHSWKAAICGQFHKHCCPKGRACNFLHVFRNPGNAFYAADRDHQEWRRKLQRERDRDHSPPSHQSHDRSWSGSPENSRRRRNWRWSASPSPEDRPSSHRSNSVRSHRDKRENSSRKKTTDRRREDCSDRSRVCSRERSRAKVRSQNVDRDSSSRRDHKRTSRKGRNHSEVENNMSRDSKELCEPAADPKTKPLVENCKSGCDTRITGKEGLETSHNPCIENLKVAVSSNPCGTKNYNTELENNQTMKLIDVSTKKSRKKDRKTKKKDSHRKEKRRKTKSRGRSHSSSSTHSSDS